MRAGAGEIFVEIYNGVSETGYKIVFLYLLIFLNITFNLNVITPPVTRPNKLSEAVTLFTILYC